jgi:hypothetical protein
MNIETWDESLREVGRLLPVVAWNGAGLRSGGSGLAPVPDLCHSRQQPPTVEVRAEAVYEFSSQADQCRNQTRAGSLIKTVPRLTTMEVHP